jgi:hypothetical protein
MVCVSIDDEQAYLQGVFNGDDLYTNVVTDWLPSNGSNPANDSETVGAMHICL